MSHRRQGLISQMIDFVNALWCQHTAVSNENHMLYLVNISQFLSLLQYRGLIGGVATKHLDGNWAAVGRS